MLTDEKANRYTKYIVVLIVISLSITCYFFRGSLSSSVSEEEKVESDFLSYKQSIETVFSEYKISDLSSKIDLVKDNLNELLPEKLSFEISDDNNLITYAADPWGNRYEVFFSKDAFWIVCCGADGLADSDYAIQPVGLDQIDDYILVYHENNTALYGFIDGLSISEAPVVIDDSVVNAETVQIVGSAMVAGGLSFPTSDDAVSAARVIYDSLNESTQKTIYDIAEKYIRLNAQQNAAINSAAVCLSDSVWKEIESVCQHHLTEDNRYVFSGEKQEIICQIDDESAFIPTSYAFREGSHGFVDGNGAVYQFKVNDTIVSDQIHHLFISVLKDGKEIQKMEGDYGDVEFSKTNDVGAVWHCWHESGNNSLELGFFGSDKKGPGTQVLATLNDLTFPLAFSSPNFVFATGTLANPFTKSLLLIPNSPQLINGEISMTELNLEPQSNVTPLSTVANSKIQKNAVVSTITGNCL